MSFWKRANSPVADKPPAASTKGPLAAIENLAAPGSCGPSSGAPSASSKAASEASSGVGIEALGRSESVQKLLSRMERLPSVPALYTQVLSELARPQASIQFVGRLISKDPAMTARILQMVNSAAFALPVPIAEPMEAVLHLGVERTKSLLLLAGLTLQFDSSVCPGFSHEALWCHSLVVSGSARQLALLQTKDANFAEMAYTAGLLHDVGKLMLAANLSETYGQIIDQAARRHIEVSQVEREIFDATHAELAACLLTAWGLPASILDAIAWHHSPARSRDTGFSILTAVHVANAVEREKLLHKAGLLTNQMDFPYLDSLGLTGQRNSWREACGFPVFVVDDPKKERVGLRQAVRG